MPPDAGSGQKLAFVLAHWRFPAVVVAAAALLTFAVSELLPRRYTATTTVIIDPPATSDVRSAASLNPAYLDSLRTFEHFFTSDALFQEAAARFHIDLHKDNIENVRARALKVTQQHETRILEISATLRDPAAACELARFITERSIASSREQAVASDRESMSNLNAESERARAELERAQAEWLRASEGDTPDSIQTALDSKISLESDMRTRQNEAEADAEEWRIRARDGNPGDRDYANTQAQAAAARRDDYAKHGDRIAAEIVRDRTLLAARSSRLTLASTQLDLARKAFENAQTRTRDFAAVAGMRTERMRMIDPGVVPRKPSSPKVLLNTVAAILLSSCLAIGWLVFRAADAKPRAVFRATQRLA